MSTLLQCQYLLDHCLGCKDCKGRVPPETMSMAPKWIQQIVTPMFVSKRIAAATLPLPPDSLLSALRALTGSSSGASSASRSPREPGEKTCQIPHRLTGLPCGAKLHHSVKRAGWMVCSKCTGAQEAVVEEEETVYARESQMVYISPTAAASAEDEAESADLAETEEHSKRMRFSPPIPIVHSPLLPSPLAPLSPSPAVPVRERELVEDTDLEVVVPPREFDYCRWAARNYIETDYLPPQPRVPRIVVVTAKKPKRKRASPSPPSSPSPSHSPSTPNTPSPTASRDALAAAKCKMTNLPGWSEALVLSAQTRLEELWIAYADPKNARYAQDDVYIILFGVCLEHGIGWTMAEYCDTLSIVLKKKNRWTIVVHRLRDELLMPFRIDAAKLSAYVLPSLVARFVQTTETQDVVDRVMALHKRLCHARYFEEAVVVRLSSTASSSAKSKPVPNPEMAARAWTIPGLVCIMLSMETDNLSTWNIESVLATMQYKMCALQLYRKTMTRYLEKPAS